MKRLFTLTFASLLLLGLATSCCKSDHQLTSSKAKKLVKKELARLHGDVSYTNLLVGYYECNDSEYRFQLRQLAANDLITYSCERVKKEERVRKSRQVQRNYYYYSYTDTEYYYDNDTIDTYFVTVALTEKGKKYLIDSLPEPDKNKDYLELKYDFVPNYSKYPEFKVDTFEFADEKRTFDTVYSDTEMADEADFDAPDEDFSGAGSAYEMAKAKEKVDAVLVEAYSVKVVKVRNIRQNPVAMTCTAEAVMECSKATPFGRIMLDVYEGSRYLHEDVSFTYYNDKGWNLTVDKDE